MWECSICGWFTFSENETLNHKCEISSNKAKTVNSQTTDYTKLLLSEVCDLVLNQESNFEEAELYGILSKALSAAETRGYEIGIKDTNYDN